MFDTALLANANHRFIVLPTTIGVIAASMDFSLLLNTRYPIASFAAGMTVLTRNRPNAAETIVVSSATDPFSETRVLEFGEGDAMGRGFEGLLDSVLKIFGI